MVRRRGHWCRLSIMANIVRFDLTGDDDAGLPLQPPPPFQQQQQQQQDTTVVAIHCGEKGLAVCGVRADLRIKRPTRPYVVTGFEHITDSSYRGTHKLHALAGMVQRSQVLGSAFAADAHSFVVLTRAKTTPGADNMTLDAVKRRQGESARIASTTRQHHPHAQILDIVTNSTNTAVSTFLQQHPKKQAQAAVAAGSASALEAARTFGTLEYSKAKRRTQVELVEAAKTFLGSNRVSMEDTVSDPVAAFEVYSKPVDAIRAVATAFWMAMYALDQKPASLVLKSSAHIQQQQQPVSGASAGASPAGAATRASPAAAAAAAGGPAAQVASFMASLTPARLAAAQGLINSFAATGNTAAGMQPPPPQAGAAAAAGRAAGAAGLTGGRSPGTGHPTAAVAAAACGASPYGLLQPQTHPQECEAPQHRQKRRRRSPASAPLPFASTAPVPTAAAAAAAAAAADPIVISDSE